MEKFFQPYFILFTFLYKNICKLKQYWCKHKYIKLPNSGMMINNIFQFQHYIYICPKCNNTLSPEDFKKYERKQKIKTIL
jgi:hypothetical protein